MFPWRKLGFFPCDIFLTQNQTRMQCDFARRLSFPGSNPLSHENSTENPGTASCSHMTSFKISQYISHALLKYSNHSPSQLHMVGIMARRIFVLILTFTTAFCGEFFLTNMFRPTSGAFKNTETAVNTLKNGCQVYLCRRTSLYARFNIRNQGNYGLQSFLL